MTITVMSLLQSFIKKYGDDVFEDIFKQYKKQLFFNFLSAKD